MTITDRLPGLPAEELQNLLSNARRLSAEGGTRGEAADELLPLVEAELALRAEKTPAKKGKRAKATT